MTFLEIMPLLGRLDEMPAVEQKDGHAQLPARGFSNSSILRAKYGAAEIHGAISPICRTRTWNCSGPESGLPKVSIASLRFAGMIRTTARAELFGGSSLGKIFHCVSAMSVNTMK